MALDGECIKETFFLIPENPIPSTPSLPLATSRLRDCCGAFSFKALADIADDDEFKNDRNTVDWFFSDFVSAAVLKLMKFDGSAYTEVDDLDDDTYGTFSDYGVFVNNAGEKYIGYNIDWRLVIDAFDPGSYKVQVTITTPFGDTDILSDEYCVQAFTEARANNTVKIEYYLSGIIGDNSNDLKTRDFGTLNRYNSIRVPGWFGFPGSEYAKDYTIYRNGARKWIKDEQEQEFEMQIKAVGSKVHELMRTDALQSDELFVTDYNKNNAQVWIQKSVQVTSGYPPDWKVLRSKLAPVKLTFRSAINNNKKYRE